MERRPNCGSISRSRASTNNASCSLDQLVRDVVWSFAAKQKGKAATNTDSHRRHIAASEDRLIAAGRTSWCRRVVPFNGQGRRERMMEAIEHQHAQQQRTAHDTDGGDTRNRYLQVERASATSEGHDKWNSLHWTVPSHIHSLSSVTGEIRERGRN